MKTVIINEAKVNNHVSPITLLDSNVTSASNEDVKINEYSFGRLKFKLFFFH